MDPIRKITIKAHLFLGLIIATVVCLGVFVLGELGIHATWPAFFVMISFFITGADVKNLPRIFIGAVTGLILAYLLLMFAVPSITAFGPTLGLLLLVWIIIFAIIFGGVFVPHALNDFAFIYFTIALIFAGEAAKMTPAALISEHVTWGLTAILGGGGILACIIGSIALARKAGVIPPADAAGH